MTRYTIEVTGVSGASYTVQIEARCARAAIRIANKNGWAVRRFV